MALLTLAQAKSHLRITTDTTSPLSEEDEDITLKLAQAEHIVLDYLKVADSSPPTWDADTVPLLVSASILYVLGELYRFRGDDPDGDRPSQTDGYLSPLVTNMLRRLRDPALA